MTTTNDDRTVTPLKPVESAILSAIKELKYGTVEVTVHDAEVVQVSKTEKTRFRN